MENLLQSVNIDTLMPQLQSAFESAYEAIVEATGASTLQDHPVVQATSGGKLKPFNSKEIQYDYNNPLFGLKYWDYEDAALGWISYASSKFYPYFLIVGYVILS